MSRLSSALLSLCHPLLTSTTANSQGCSLAPGLKPAGPTRGTKCGSAGGHQGPWGVGEAPPAGSLQLSPRLSVTWGWAFLPSGLWTCSGRGGELGTPLRSGELRDGALCSQHPHLRQSTSFRLCLLGWVPRKGSFEKSVLSLKKKKPI